MCTLFKSVPIIINSAPMNEIISLRQYVYTTKGKEKTCYLFRK